MIVVMGKVVSVGDAASLPKFRKACLWVLVLVVVCKALANCSAAQSSQLVPMRPWCTHAGQVEELVFIACDKMLFSRDICVFGSDARTFSKSEHANTGGFAGGWFCCGAMFARSQACGFSAECAVARTDCVILLVHNENVWWRVLGAASTMAAILFNMLLPLFEAPQLVLLLLRALSLVLLLVSVN